MFVLFLPFFGNKESGPGQSYLAFKHASDELSPMEAEGTCRRWGGKIPVLKKDDCGQDFQRLSLISQQDITSFWTIEKEGNYYKRLTVSKRSARHCHRYQKMFLQFNSNSYAELEIDDITYVTVCVVSNTWVFFVTIFLFSVILLICWGTVVFAKNKIYGRVYQVL